MSSSCALSVPGFSPAALLVGEPGDVVAEAIIAGTPSPGTVQLVPADQWDRSAYESMLVDLEIDGVMREALVSTGKIGWGVVLDRATGEFLHAFRTAYDNTITGWTPEGRAIWDPSKIPAIEVVDSGRVFEICPHIHGARNLQAPSFSPETGFYYLGVNNSCMNAQAVKPTRVRCLPLVSLRQSAARDPALGLKLYEAMARELAATRDLMLTTGQRSAMERVASFLLALSRRNQRNGQDPTSFELPMTRTDIGDFLGLTIETVSRSFTKLKLMNLIELPHSTQVKLIDIDGLAALADGSY